MTSPNYYSNEEEEMELEGVQPDQIHIKIVAQLATLSTDVKHLLRVAEQNTIERSRLGERVGLLEQLIPEDLDKRLKDVEVQQGKMAVLGIALIVLSPLIWGEVSKRMEAQPSMVHPAQRK